MAIRKTHVKSAKRQKREKEQAAIKEAARKKSKKPVLGKKQKLTVESGFRVSTEGLRTLTLPDIAQLQFKSQSERYKDISVDLKSLLDDAVERYGRYDVQAKPDQTASDEEDEDMVRIPASHANPV